MHTPRTSFLKEVFQAAIVLNECEAGDTTTLGEPESVQAIVHAIELAREAAFVAIQRSGKKDDVIQSLGSIFEGLSRACAGEVDALREAAANRLRGKLRDAYRTEQAKLDSARVAADIRRKEALLAAQAKFRSQHDEQIKELGLHYDEKLKELARDGSALERELAVRLDEQAKQINAIHEYEARLRKAQDELCIRAAEHRELAEREKEVRRALAELREEARVSRSQVRRAMKQVDMRGGPSTAASNAASTVASNAAADEHDEERLSVLIGGFVASYADECKSLCAAIDTMKRDKVGLERRAAAAEAEAATATANAERSAAELTHAQQKMAEETERAEALGLQMRQAEKELASEAARVEEAKEALRRTEEERDAAAAASAAVVAQLNAQLAEVSARAEAELDAARKREAFVTRLLEDARAEARRVEEASKTQLEALRAESSSALERLAAAEQRLEHGDRELESLRLELERTETERAREKAAAAAYRQQAEMELEQERAKAAEATAEAEDMVKAQTAAAAATGSDAIDDATAEALAAEPAARGTECSGHSESERSENGRHLQAMRDESNRELQAMRDALAASQADLERLTRLIADAASAGGMSGERAAEAMVEVRLASDGLGFAARLDSERAERRRVLEALRDEKEREHDGLAAHQAELERLQKDRELETMRNALAAKQTENERLQARLTKRSQELEAMRDALAATKAELRLTAEAAAAVGFTLSSERVAELAQVRGKAASAAAEAQAAMEARMEAEAAIRVEATLEARMAAERADFASRLEVERSEWRRELHAVHEALAESHAELEGRVAAAGGLTREGRARLVETMMAHMRQLTAHLAYALAGLRIGTDRPLETALLSSHACRINERRYMWRSPDANDAAVRAVPAATTIVEAAPEEQVAAPPPVVSPPQFRRGRVLHTVKQAEKHPSTSAPLLDPSVAESTMDMLAELEVLAQRTMYKLAGESDPEGRVASKADVLLRPHDGNGSVSICHLPRLVQKTIPQTSPREHRQRANPLPSPPADVAAILSSASPSPPPLRSLSKFMAADRETLRPSPRAPVISTLRARVSI
jgi:hypothetical protein